MPIKLAITLVGILSFKKLHEPVKNRVNNRYIYIFILVLKFLTSKTLLGLIVVGALTELFPDLD